MFTAQDLRQFYGSEKYYRLGKLVYTEGIKFLTENGCHWLVYDISLFQMLPAIEKQDFQSWVLTVKDNVGELVCTDGNDNILHRVNIPYTDFPLPEITIFVERGSIDGKTEVMVCMLPSER